jgi:general secretion pathway protein D
VDGSNPIRRATWPLAAVLLLLALALSTLRAQGAPAPPPGPGGTTPQQPAQTLDQGTIDAMQTYGVKLNFEDIDIKTLARLIGQITGRNIVVDQKVQGKVTLVSPNRLSPSEAWEMFESAIEAYGFGIQQRDGVYRVVPIATSNAYNTGINGTRGAAGARVLVAVIKMANISSDQAVNALRPLLTPTGTITPVANSNTIVVADQAVVVKRVIAVAKRIDIATEKPVIRIYYPQRVRAADVAKNLEQIFPDRNQVKITVNLAANALLILATPQQHLIIQRILASLERHPQNEAEARQFWVYYLQYAQADDLAKILAEMLAERQRLEQQQQQSGVPTAAAPGVTLPLSSPNSTVIQPPTLQAPPGQPGLAPGNYANEPSRENPNPQPSPFQQGAATLPQNQTGGTFPVSPAQTPLNQANFASNKVSADVSNNALVFYMTQTEWLAVKRLVEQLDIPRKQVLVSAIIAEVSPKKNDVTGIQWQILSKQGVIVGQGAGQSLSALLSTLSSGNFVVGSIDPTTTTINVNGQNIQFPNNYALLNFLTTTTDFNLLASPRLLTHNNKQADISVGQVVPFATGVKFDINGQPIVNFDYREVGLNLKLTPHISQGQSVRLEVHGNLQEVVDFFKTGTGAAAVSVPVVSKREVNTEVSLADGQTLIIGGLVQRNTLRTIKKIPILGDIPFLGDLLFKQKDETVSKTTLFIFLTPHIVDSPQKAREINDQYQQMFERKMKLEKDYNNDWEYHPAKTPQTSPLDPTHMPVPGPVPTPEAGPVPSPEHALPEPAPAALPSPASSPSPAPRPMNWQ